jgi:hypothetical protein
MRGQNYKGKVMGSRQLIFTALVASVVSFCAPGAFAQQVTVQTDGAELLAEPKAGASVVTKLKKGTAGEQIGKQGMYVNLKTPAGTGWTLPFNLAYPSSGAASSGGGRRGPTFSGKPQVQATIGIRGLSPDEMRNAVTDPEQLKLLDTYVASAQDAEAAAGQSGLSAVRMEYFK